MRVMAKAAAAGLIAVQLGGCALLGDSTVNSPLLVGPWRIEDVNGGGVPDGARLTIEFGVDGRVAGVSGCNRFTGPYETRGKNKVRIGPLATTRKMCPEALMDIEAKTLAALAATRRHQKDETGAVVLSGGEQRLTLRPGS